MFSPLLSKQVISGVPLEKGGGTFQNQFIFAIAPTEEKCMIFACNHAAVEAEFSPMRARSFGLPTPARKTRFRRLLSLVGVISTVRCL